MKYKKAWHEEALRLKKSGLSGRKIAKIIGISKTQVNCFLQEVKSRDEHDKNKHPKVLLFDLESAPELYYGFGRYKQNIQEDFVVRSGYLLSFCAKWLNEDTIASYALPYYKKEYSRNPLCDKALCEDLHTLLSEADVVVAHNLNGFDWKLANTRFVYHGLSPVSPTKLIDTLKIAKSQFKFPTNRLDTIARYLNVGKKLPHSGASLWRGCMDNIEEDWKMMVDYNTVDVDVLEQVYLKLRAFDNRHPNIALFYPDNKMRCVCCGSENLKESDKKAYTSISEFEVFQCQDCGKHNRSRKNTLNKDKKDSLFMNVS